jgi:UrcA family protein
MKTATQLAFPSGLKSIIGSTTIVVLCIAGSMDAWAGSETDASVARSAKVSIAGLDPSTPEGARAVRERLRQTARKLCAQVADELDLSHHANYVACVDESVAKAMQQIAPSSIVAGATATSERKSHP